MKNEESHRSGRLRREKDGWMDEFVCVSAHGHVYVSMCMLVHLEVSACMHEYTQSSLCEIDTQCETHTANGLSG